MPPNEAAAAATAAYRSQLLAIRDHITRLTAGALAVIDLDGDLEVQLERWTNEAEATVRLGQREAARLARAYVGTYLRAAGVEPPTPATPPTGSDLDDPEPFAGNTRAALATAPAALLWRLGRRDGRPAALASGVSRATRVTRTSVMEAARTVQQQRMEAEPRVVGWVRVTSSRPCGACLGATTRTVSRKPLQIHDSCRCTSEPVLRGIPEQMQRPTGQELFDGLSPAEQDALFAGTGGAEKAALVRERGVGILTDTRSGRLTEARLVNL
jgi:hypothetical protein